MEFNHAIIFQPTLLTLQGLFVLKELLSILIDALFT